MKNKDADICKMSIVCLDKEIKSLMLLQDLMLGRYNSHNILFTTDKVGAMSEVIQVVPDIMVLCVYHPTTEYESFIQTLANVNKKLKVIVVTRLSDAGAIERYIRAGAHKYISTTTSNAYFYNKLDSVILETFYERLNRSKLFIAGLYSCGLEANPVKAGDKP